jgi:hypothetical protein
MAVVATGPVSRVPPLGPAMPSLSLSLSSFSLIAGLKKKKESAHSYDDLPLPVTHGEPPYSWLPDS